MSTLKRFWFTFAPMAHPTAINLGCGVTAINQQDALAILKQTVFRGRNMPQIREVIENIDISALDQRHVIPNMGPPHVRGVWFPLGY